MTTGGAENQNATLMRHKRFPISVYLASIVGPRALHTILPERVADGLYQGFARDLSMGAGCTPPPADLVETESREHPRGQAFWVDVMTTIDGHKIADPRPALRSNTTPVLVMRAQCDFLAWPVTREYRDLLPNATMVTIAGSGHTIVRDQPGPYEDNIVSFLSGEPLPRKPYTGEAAPW
jgi:proline iminopeptidase